MVQDNPESIKWAVALTTAPRKDCTLNVCIEHLKTCGWEPIIFAEPGSTKTDCQTITNKQKKGVWHNWLSSAKWCLENTDADVILTVQDDTILHPDSKTFAESCMWPAADCGFLSLYTPKHYSINKKGELKAPGVNRIWTNALWGACALVFPREALRRIAYSAIADQWLGSIPKTNDSNIFNLRRNDPSTIANSDMAIGKIINSMRLSMWFVDPSPGIHIARYSTCGHGDNTGQRNAYRKADFNTPLNQQIPIHNKMKLNNDYNYFNSV